jgi:arylsulfatase
MQSYFPDGPVDATPYAGEMQIPLDPQTIYSRKKGERAQAISDYDA